MEIVSPLTQKGATIEMIKAIETRLGADLPDDYRDFLMTYNGGRPLPDRFEFMTENGPSQSDIQFFLSIDDECIEYSVQEYLHRYHERIPELMAPIACDSFGNLVLLDVGAKAPGAVFFWDHERESMDDVTWDNIDFICDSFSSFLKMLK